MAEASDFTDRNLERMLLEWGREYRLDWVELLGHQGKNVLYDLIRFRGRIPLGSSFRQISVNESADTIEQIVMRLFTINPRVATCLRLLYCGRGTVQDKAEMAAEATKTPISKATFKTMIRLGQMYILGALNARKP